MLIIFMEHNFSLKEWSLKAETSCESRNSRRLSGSILRSSREEERSFRSNATISSTSSSPGYMVRDEIDPSTYSFTTALKALQAKTVYAWEYISPDGGLTLNSKWNDAEKYISNPLSGEVPLECLSAKTLSGRSLGSLTRRITMSAPLIYSAHLQHQFQAKFPSEKDEVKVTIQERKRSMTRDVGIQSNLSSRSPSPSPAPTPSIEERPRKLSQGESADSSNSSSKVKYEDEVEEVRETRKEEKYTKRNEGIDRKKTIMCRCIKGQGGGGGGGCLSFKGLWGHKDKHKARNTTPYSSPFLFYVNACYKE